MDWLHVLYSFIYMRGLKMFYVCLSLTLQMFKVTLIVLTKGLITLMKTQMLDTNGHTKQEIRQMPVQEDHVFFIPKEQLEDLRSLHFSWNKIADMFGVSERTIRRQRGNWDVNRTEKVL